MDGDLENRHSNPRSQMEAEVLHRPTFLFLHFRLKSCTGWLRRAPLRSFRLAFGWVLMRPVEANSVGDFFGRDSLAGMCQAVFGRPDLTGSWMLRRAGKAQRLP